MTTEEIDKAGKRYAYNIIPDENGMTFPVERSELSKAFKEGVQFADNHWQEKTRWIPVEERLPKVRKTPFFIAVTAHDGSDKFRANIKTFLIRDESDIRWMVMNCKYWKEIEL